MRNFYSLYLNNNQLSGTIPSTIGLMRHLQQLYLNNNQCSISFSFCSLIKCSIVFRTPNSGPDKNIYLFLSRIFIKLTVE